MFVTKIMLNFWFNASHYMVWISLCSFYSIRCPCRHGAVASSPLIGFSQDTTGLSISVLFWH